MDDDMERYREAMHKLRGPVRPDRGELPRDPDADHMPPGLEALDDRLVTITGVDRASGEVVQLQGVIAVVPGLHGDAARRES